MSLLFETSIVAYCIMNTVFIFYKLYTEKEIAKLKDHYEHQLTINRDNYLTASREIRILDDYNKHLIEKLNEQSNDK